MRPAGAVPAGAGLGAFAGWCSILLIVAAALSEREVGLPPVPAGAYPAAPPGPVVDNYHGVPVADPWRWLEAMDSAETRSWIRAQNELTGNYLAALPGREQFARRLRALMDYERRGVPEQENGVYAYAWNPGQAEQDVLRVTTDLARPGRVLVDPATVRADGTVSLADFVLSPDGSRVAYALSDGGSDWKTWRIRDVATGVDLPDVIEGTKFTTVSWSRDSTGFYYSRYPRVADGRYDDRRSVAVHFHRAGTAADADPLVYAITDHPTREPYARVTEDGRFLVFTVREGYVTNAIHYQPLTGHRPAGPVVRLLDAWDARYEFLGETRGEFYFLTTHRAPRGRVVAIAPARAAPDSWRQVIAESDATIEAAVLAGSRLVVQYVQAVSSQLRLHALDGALVTDVPLPGAGSVEGLRGRVGEAEAFFSYSDFARPRRVYRLDAASGVILATGSAIAGPDPDGFVSEQVFYTSRDGTRVPLSIVRRRDVTPTGQQPTVLYGYGGFNVALLPEYSAARMAWIEAGGVYAQANLRGGGEFGEAWHLAGTRLAKQNVFDDFVAAARWLMDAGWTSPRNLAIWGGSNGGLLVAAVLNQHPELFAAAVPAVGVLDMLRYHTASLNARQWSSDYGLSEDPEEFAALRAYSPYHNLGGDACYPPVLVQADANDDRVAAWHSYKYAAALQAAQARGRANGTPVCGSPALIRIETRSGHGAGAALSKRVGEYADQWAFVGAATGLTRPRPVPAVRAD